MRSRRSEMDNRIDTFASPPVKDQHQHGEVSPEAAAVGESIMEEFLLFLTLKGKGLSSVLCSPFLQFCTGAFGRERTCLSGLHLLKYGDGKRER